MLSYPLSNLISDNLGDFVSGTSGGFFGALFALLFGWWKDSRDRANTKYAAVLNLQISLLGHLLTLESFGENPRVRDLDPERRHLDLPSLTLTADKSSVDLGSIGFLMNEGAPTLLLDIGIADRSYYTFLESVELRNSYYRQFFESLVEIKEFNKDTRETTAVVDPAKVAYLRDLTDSVFRFWEIALEKNKEAVGEIRMQAKKFFPRKELYNLSD